jgi:hypothetical protein
MRVLCDLTVQLYEVLLRVDKSVPHLRYMDAGQNFYPQGSVHLLFVGFSGFLF